MLDCNVVNQFVTGVSFGKDINTLLPHGLIQDLPRANYVLGACEAYGQRAKVTKTQALKICEHIFETLGRPIPSPQQYRKAYDHHLAVYAATLQLLSHRHDWEGFRTWSSINKLPLSKWTLRFAMLLTGEDRTFASQRLTHLHGNDTSDEQAKSAWNVAWDIALLDQADARHGHVVTHDKGLAQWFEHAKGTSCSSLPLTEIGDIVKLTHALEDTVGTTCHFDAGHPYAEGLWPLHSSGI